MNKWSHADAKTSHGLTSLYWLIVMIAVVMISSLTACVPLQQPSLSQPISPPPRVLDSPLIDNRWRVETVTHQGEDVPLDTVAPIYIVFTDNGLLNIDSYKDLGDGVRCGSATYAIEYVAGQAYRIGEGMAPAVHCPNSSQFADVKTALRATNEYELNEDALTLRGEEAEMRLVLDNP